MCLQPVGGSNNLGDAIVQEPCNGSAAQIWEVVNVSSSLFHLINSVSHLCLDARGGATNGTPVQQWTCNAITNINWRINPANNLLTSAVSNTSNHCVTTPGNQAGAAMTLQTCANTQPEFWLRAAVSVTQPPSDPGCGKPPMRCP